MVDMSMLLYEKVDDKHRFKLECDICGKVVDGFAHELVDNGWNFSFTETTYDSIISFAVCGDESEEDMRKIHKKYQKMIDKLSKE